MARVTIEDCIEKVPNRFHLVQMAAIRAKQLKQGANTLVEGDGNKAVVISLREIAAGLIQPDYPEEDLEAGPDSPQAPKAEAPAAEPDAATATK
jgi:DNA-directed RNA polymerase subunit omega